MCRPAFVGYILIAAFVTLLYGITTNPWILLVFGPVVAFFGTGFFSGFAAVTAEIYPTSIRAVAQGFTFNVGRLGLSLIHISEPTRLLSISYAVFCLKKKKS